MTLLSSPTKTKLHKVHKSSKSIKKCFELKMIQCIQHNTYFQELDLHYWWAPEELLKYLQPKNVKKLL